MKKDTDAEMENQSCRAREDRPKGGNERMGGPIHCKTEKQNEICDGKGRAGTLRGAEEPVLSSKFVPKNVEYYERMFLKMLKYAGNIAMIKMEVDIWKEKYMRI